MVLPTVAPLTRSMFARALRGQIGYSSVHRCRPEYWRWVSPLLSLIWMVAPARAAAKGWRSVIGGIVGGKNTALIALIIGSPKTMAWRCGFGWRWVVNHFSFESSSPPLASKAPSAPPPAAAPPAIPTRKAVVWPTISKVRRNALQLRWSQAVSSLGANPPAAVSANVT